MINHLKFVAFSLVLCAAAQAQHFTPFPASSATRWKSSGASVVAFSDNGEASEAGEAKDDPGYKLYKEGYNLILNEEWASARKKFSEMIDKYPKSEYLDDARYWSAFALKHSDKKKALEAYKKFLDDYPKSSYYDDAINDYLELNGGLATGLTGDQMLRAEAQSDAQGSHSATYSSRAGRHGYVESSGGTAPVVRSYNINGSGKGYGYAYSIAPSVRMSEDKMRLAERQMSRQLARLSPMPSPRGVPAPPALALAPGSLRFFGDRGEEYDRETRLKMDALYAIGETKEDSISYMTLRDVAVDIKQPRVLRETAMDALANFSHFDVLPVFLEVAKKDTSEEIQNMAIDYMGQLSRNRNKSFETLADLFNVIPKSRTTQLQTVLGSIAEIGNDKAVDFLANVARTHEDYDLRSDAVYYLGNIGGDKAREALYEILKAK